MQDFLYDAAMRVSAIARPRLLKVAALAAGILLTLAMAVAAEALVPASPSVARPDKRVGEQSAHGRRAASPARAPAAGEMAL